MAKNGGEMSKKLNWLIGEKYSMSFFFQKPVTCTRFSF